MGTAYGHICNKCGYRVTTSGGLAYGMFAATDTYICKSCREIVDVSVGTYGKTISKENTLKKSTEGDDDFEYYVCPVCGSDKHLEIWNTKEKPCPRCDGKMSRSGRLDFIMWD